LHIAETLANNKYVSARQTTSIFSINQLELLNKTANPFIAGKANSLKIDRHTFYLTTEKIRYQGEENDCKVFEASSPAKYKSNCTKDDS